MFQIDCAPLSYTKNDNDMIGVELTADFTFNEMAAHIENNREEIERNAKTYGFEISEIAGIRNYYDLAHVLGIDTDITRDCDHQVVAELACSILTEYEY